jgi:hypothetical protein
VTKLFFPPSYKSQVNFIRIFVMSTITFLNQNVVRNRYGAMLAAIHARLAEVAAGRTSEELDSFKFVRERGRGLLPDIATFRYAEREAKQFQAQFDAVDWNPLSTDLYWLKLGVEVLSLTLQCTTTGTNTQVPQMVPHDAAYAVAMAA